MVQSTFYKSLLVSLSFLSLSPPAGNSENSRPSLTAMPTVPLNKHVRQFVKSYIRHNHQDLYAIRQRSRAAFATIDSVFGKYHLPLELKYLAVIESDLKTTAVSRVGAVGPWQFMPATAQQLGLKVTRAHDERTQYNRSTRAAAKYLRDLYTEFGDWLLVLAAYNGGPGPVLHAIHKSGSRDFWNLQCYLPAESRAHVKRFIATHYYFEGQGNMTTLTRSECLALPAAQPTEAPSVAAGRRHSTDHYSGFTGMVASGIFVAETPASWIHLLNLQPLIKNHRLHNAIKSIAKFNS